MTTQEFMAGIEAVAHQFDSASYPQQALPADDLAILVKSGMLLPALPREYGGRDSHIEMCRVIEATSEWNLPLGLYLMVITCLGLRPIAMFGTEEARREVLPAFAGSDPMGAGFAATEPGAGSALSSITTEFERVADGYHIRGRKHWQALSMSAHWWVVLARSAGKGPREYGLFIVKRSEGFRTIQPYDALGLKVIDYGLNEIDAYVPEYRRLQVRDDTQCAAEIVMSTRAFMATTASGFLRRLSHEAHHYANNRLIGRRPLSAIRFARYRLKEIDASATIAAALTYYVQTSLDFRTEMVGSLPAIHAIKIVSSERMLSSALNYQQLAGGEGYRHGSPTNIAAQAVLDARVFTVFDGNNDLLSQQLAEHCTSRLHGRRLSDFLAAWTLTGPAIATHRIDLTFLDRASHAQEYRVLAGRVIANVFAMTRVMHWANQVGVDAATVYTAIEFLKADITQFAGQFALLDSGILEDSYPVSREPVDHRGSGLRHRLGLRR